MEPDLDHNDEIGVRIRALHEWAPPAATDEVWHVVETRRRRRTRRVAVGAGAAFVAIGLLVALTVAATGGSSRRVRVVTPPPTTFAPVARLLPALAEARLGIDAPGPYQPGQSVHVSLSRAYADALPFDALNNNARLCYAWGAGELCDPSGAMGGGAQQIGADYVWTVSLRGWVSTPAGLLACERVDCRVEIDDHTHRVATTRLDIAPGPQPVEAVRIATVGDDGTLLLASRGLDADPSWTRWNHAVAGTIHSEIPPGGFSICAFGVGCDAIVYPATPPFDGRPHDITVPTNRLILTPEGWIDCARVTCYIGISRAIGVIANGPSVASSAETIGVLPYRIASKTAVRRPTLTIEPRGPLKVGDTFVATLHDPPPHRELARLELAQCGSADLRLVEDCIHDFSAQWQPQADGTLRRTQKVSACRDNPQPCYVAVLPAAKGYPEIARTARFPVAP